MKSFIEKTKHWRSLFWVCAFLLGLCTPAHSQLLNYPAHLDTALTYVGTTEATGNNDGKEVEMFLASVDLGGGYAWCAAFGSYCLDAAPHVTAPDIRSPLASDFIIDNSVRAREVLRGQEEIPAGTIAIWRKGDTMFGHLAIVKSWGHSSGVTVEGNTSPGKYGSQSDGDGVYIRQRSIIPTNYFRITNFTYVTIQRPTQKRSSLYNSNHLIFRRRYLGWQWTGTGGY